MAITVPSGKLDHIDFVLAQINQIRFALAASTSKVHADTTSSQSGDSQGGYTLAAYSVSAANGNGTLANLTALCTDLYMKYVAHINDTSAHKVADTTNTLAETLASVSPATGTLANCITFLNDLHTKYTAHIGSTTFHCTADATNTDASAAAADQPTSDTRANALKTAFNAHEANALAGSGFIVVNP